MTTFSGILTEKADRRFDVVSEFNTERVCLRQTLPIRYVSRARLARLASSRDASAGVDRCPKMGG